jgi:hypothetical protein
MANEQLAGFTAMVTNKVLSEEQIEELWRCREKDISLSPEVPLRHIVLCLGNRYIDFTAAIMVYGGA